MSKNLLEPIVRVYIDDLLAGTSTEISNNVTYARIEMRRDAAKGSFSLTVRPERLSSAYTDLWLQDVIPSVSKHVKIRAGYVLSGVENITTCFTGTIKDRNATYGRGGGAFSVTGFDLADKIEQVEGTWTGADYGTAKPFMIKILNDALVTNWNFDGFTDFSIADIDFVNDNGLQVFQRLRNYSQFQFFFDGTGTFVCRDIPSDSVTKYDYASAPIATIAFNFSSRPFVTEVNVIGDGVTLTRRTGLSDQQRYGRVNQFLQNSIITTSAEAIAAADKIITESRKKNCNFNVPFNPYVVTDEIVSVQHEEIGGSAQYRITGFTHWFDGNAATAKTSIQCEEVSPIIPAIYTVV